MFDSQKLDSEPRGAWFHRLLPTFTATTAEPEHIPKFGPYFVILHHVLKVQVVCCVVSLFCV